MLGEQKCPLFFGERLRVADKLRAQYSPASYPRLIDLRQHALKLHFPR